VVRVAKVDDSTSSRRLNDSGHIRQEVSMEAFQHYDESSSSFMDVDAIGSATRSGGKGSSAQQMRDRLFGSFKNLPMSN
jgi:hypothetical protein